MEKLIRKNLKNLEKIFEKEGVVLAYLFGSAAKGKIHRFSDFDFGVLLNKKIQPDDYFDKRLKIASEIGRLLRTDYVDIIILNKAKPFLKYQVIFSGKPIFIKNRGIQILFENQTMKEYQDTKHILKISLEAMVKRIKGGTFGQPSKIYVPRS